MIPFKRPKTRKFHLSKHQVVIVSVMFVSIFLFFDKTSDVTLSCLSPVVTLYSQEKYFVLKSNTGCSLLAFTFRALVYFFDNSAVYHKWIFS